MLKKALIPCASVIAIGWAAPALAQGQESEQASNQTDSIPVILVTANRRAEDVQDVPIAITAVSGQMLEQANVQSIQELSTVVSGYVGPGPTPTLSPQLRGVGSQISGPLTEASVATYVDGVYIGATSPATIQLDSIAQVSVLKGPQGTLFGRNTTGGLIAITTREPGDTFEFEAQTGYSSFETFMASGYISGPIGEGVSANLSAKYTTMGEGWGTNLATGNPNNQIEDQLSVRAKVDFDLSDRTTLRLMGDYQLHRDLNFFLAVIRPGFLGVDGDVLVPPIPPGEPGGPFPAVTENIVIPDRGWDANTFKDVPSESKAFGLTAQLTHEFDFATLTNTLAYRKTTYDLFGFTGNLTPDPDSFDINVFWETEAKMLTNELLLSSTPGGAVDWTVGLFFYDNEDISDQATVRGPIGPPFNGQNDVVKQTNSYAVFGQVAFPISENLRLTGGLRYSYDTVDVDYSLAQTFIFPPFATVTNSGSQDFDGGSVTGRVSLDYSPSDDVLLYASYNRGTRNGTYNIVRPDRAPTDKEKVDAFEIGSKMEFAEGDMTLNVAAYYYAYDNKQLNSFFEPGPPSQFNGPSSEVYGLDVDLMLRPTPELTVLANAAYSNSTFGDFPNAEIFTQLDNLIPGFPGGVVTVGDATGNKLPLAPEVTANLVVNYEIPTSSAGTFNLNGNVSYNSGFFGTPGNEPENKQDAFARVGASVEWTDPSDTYFIRLFGKNLTNTRSVIQLNYTSAGPTLMYDAPRSYGVVIGARFN